MTSINKNVALLMGLAAIASVGTVYAVMQGVSSQNEVQAEHGKFLGHVSLVLYGPDGTIKAYRQTDNLVVTDGDNATANKMFFAGVQGRKMSMCGSTQGTTCTGNNVGTFNWIGVGQTNTTPDTTQTALASQVGTIKQAIGANGGSVSNGTAANTGHGTAQIQVTFAATKITNASNVPIQEAGLFDWSGTASTTNMFARQIFSSISVGSADTLQITWTIAIT